MHDECTLVTITGSSRSYAGCLGSPTYFNCIQLQHHHDGHSGSQQSSETQKVAVGHFLTSVQTKLTNTRTEPTKHSEQRSSKRAFRRKFPKSSSLPAWVLAQFFLASRRSARKGCRTSDSNQKAFEKRLWSLYVIMTRAVGAYDSEDHNNFLQYSYLQAIYYLEILRPRPLKGDLHRI